MIKFKSALPQLALKYIPTDTRKAKLTQSSDVYNYLLNLFNPDELEYSEEMVVLFLNRANNTIGYIGIPGTTSHVAVCFHKIFSSALLCGAHAIILSHNHPSGECRPSDADKLLTSEMKIAAQTLKIKLLDHLIITNQSFFSFADEGLI
jgi:DNA repair protein RadC